MTPLERAIRAGCTPWHEQECIYPACDCGPTVPNMIRAGIVAVLSDDPATIEAMARAYGTDWHTALPEQQEWWRLTSAEVLAALRRHILGEGG